MPAPSARVALGRQLRFARDAAGVALNEISKQLGISLSHLSNVEAGRDSASWKIIAFYEERFHTDGQLWVAYVEAHTSPRPPQRSGDTRRPNYPIPGDESTFIADVTVPDGTLMPPRFIFEKVWRIKNTGSVPWIGRRLARDGAAGGYGVPHSPAYVPILDTMPGHEVDIAVPVRSQPLEGTSQARWKMVDGNGYRFFPDQYPFGLFLTIVVRDNAPPPNLRRLR